MLNEDILLSILKNNFDKVITIIDEERPCYVETVDVLTITKDELKNSNTGFFVVDSINLKESDEYILEFGGRIMKGEQSTHQIGNNTVRSIEFYDSYIGDIFVNDKVILNEETEVTTYNETTAMVDMGDIHLHFEEFTDIKLKKLNIKRLSNDLLEKDLVIQNSISLGRAEDSEIGKYSCAIGKEVTASNYASHAEGSDTIASGEYSHAEGMDTTASGYASHAEGENTTASGHKSHAEGYSTISNSDYSHAEGNYARASGTSSHAEGDFTIATGKASHAEGATTTASGKNSHAEGSYTTASSNYSHAEGYNTTTSGESSHAEGHSSNKVTNVITSFSTSTSNDTITTQWGTKKFCLAKGRGSHVEGIDNLALGESSHAEGKYTKSTYMFSHSEGYYSQASGQSAHAEGNATNASGHYSHAEGDTTTASNSSSHAEGFKTTASGYHSHAEGEGTIASGTDSHAEGAKTIANGNYQHVQGKFNIEDNENKYAHIVGNGDSTARSNGHTLDWDGNAWFKGNVSIDGTPTNDNELVTKKYVDENTKLCWLEDYEATGDRLQYADVNVSSLTSRVFYAFNFKKHPGVTTVRLLKSYDDGTIKSIINLGSTLEYMYLMNISSSIMKFYLKYATGIVSECVCTFGNTSDECTFKRTPMVLYAKNTYEYTPTTDYNPATKKYVDDKFIALDLMETVGTIPQSELQKCNNGTSRYVSSIDFDTLFSEPNNYMYYATYKDDTLIPIDYQSDLNRMVTNKLDSAGSLDVFIGFDYGTHMMYPFNGGNDSIKAYTFTNDLIIKRCPLINANIIATKEYVNERVGNSVITVNNVNDSLTLTTDKNQYVTLVVPVEVILPTVTEYTEIHLFFNGSEGAQLNTTNVKWESQLTIENNKSYEVVFTYVNDVIGWLAKSIIYN